MSLDTRSSPRSTILWTFIGLLPSLGALLLAVLGAASLGGCEQGSAPPAATVATETPAQIYHAAFVALAPGAIATLESGPDADLAASQAIIDRVIAASRASECDFGADYSWGASASLPHLQEQRELARVLSADAERLLAAGDPEAAAERAAAVLRMAAQLGASSQVLIELITSLSMAMIATDLLEASPSLRSTAQRPDLLEALALAEQRTSRRMPDVLRSEAAIVAAWLRAGYPGGSDLPVLPRSPAMATRAATSVEVIADEAARVLASNRSSSALAALDARAEREMVRDVLANVGTLGSITTKGDERFRQARRSLGG